MTTDITTPAIINGKPRPPAINGTEVSARRLVSAPPVARPRRLDATERRLLNAVTVVVGCWQLTLAVVTVVAVLACWPVVDALAATSSVPVSWFGPDFVLNTTSGALLIGLVGGVAGSLVHTITIFSSRVGRDTLEATFLWWYLLRPFAAALLALLFVTAVHSGLLSISGAADGPQTAVAFVAGGLAGLFTDAVLQKLRGLLGATSTEDLASDQHVPHAIAPLK
jgi:hypothetical protein